MANKSLMSKGWKPFTQIFTLSDFGVTANVTLVASSYSEVGSKTVPAQQIIAFGADDPTGGATRAGTPLYYRVDNTSGARIDGTVRLIVSNATETSTVVVLEERTERLVASQYDRTQAVLLPEQQVVAGEDSKLIVKMKVDGASDVTLDYDGTNTKALIPVTVYQK